MAFGVPPDEETPLLMLHGGSGQASVARTAGNIFISIVGAGVLGLPYTFRMSGWAVAAASVTGAACLTYYCMLLLVRLPFPGPFFLPFFFGSFSFSCCLQSFIFIKYPCLNFVSVPFYTIWVFHKGVCKSMMPLCG
jgi:hypothetical protein